MADGTNHLSSHDADNEGQRQKPEQEKEREREASLPCFKAKTKRIASWGGGLFLSP